MAKEKQGLSVYDFLKSKKITSKEIKEQFRLEAEYDIDMSKYKGCPHCKDTINQYRKPSEPWTGVMHCVSCSSIILIHYQDRMAGIYTDKVMVYKQKKT